MAQARIRKKKKSKKNKKNKENKDNKDLSTQPNGEINKTTTDNNEEVEIEYVAPQPEEVLKDFMDEEGFMDPAFEDFKDIFEYFNPKPEEIAPEEDEENQDEKEQEPEVKPMSKKEKKRQKRQSIAVLKTRVSKPEVVEAWDVTSADPALLVFLKAYRNTVPVPRHWNQKRKYLQGKRGIEKPPFQLPDFIAATGISKIRQAIQEKEANKALKQKQRERVQPKMGRMDIDYQVLHDAFFRYQTKPKLTIHGDLYYEGKEFEITLKEKKPGKLSDELKKAIGMPEGAPPPWLINMQRYGPPPSYPNLKIPGLNAPIPEGARYGYHPGGWGKPPVDEFGRPLYGDVFGTIPQPPPEISQPIERKHWGELEIEEEEEEEEEEYQEEEEEEAPGGTETPSGFETPSGMETPESLDLRKGPTVPSSHPPPPPPSQPPPPPSDEDDEDGKPLYQIIEKQEMSVGNALFGSSHKYIIPEKKELKNKNVVDLMKSRATEKVDIALDPSEVEKLEDLNEEILKSKLDRALAEKHKQPREDVSDIIAEHQMKKRKKEYKDSKSKKYKDIKF